MKDLTNLNDLLIEMSREIYDAEKQQQEALRELTGKISSQDLKNAVSHHIDVTDIHLERLITVFEKKDIFATGEENKAMKGLIMEWKESVNRCTDPEVTDVVMIAMMQQIKHYEIATYGSICTFANILKMNDVAETLHISLEEEVWFDDQLTTLAEEGINKKAVSALVS